MQQNNRLKRLRAAREVLEELEQELDGQGKQKTRRTRSDLQTAGSKIRSAGYDRHMKDALGRIAGIAIGRGLDEIADRATRILEDDIEFPEDGHTTVEAGTDDRGRITLGAEYANQQVQVAILASNPDEANNE